MTWWDTFISWFTWGNAYFWWAWTITILLIAGIVLLVLFLTCVIGSDTGYCKKRGGSKKAMKEEKPTEEKAE